jgi:hypothetical protein
VINGYAVRDGIKKYVGILMSTRTVFAMRDVAEEVKALFSRSRKGDAKKELPEFYFIYANGDNYGDANIVEIVRGV